MRQLTDRLQFDGEKHLYYLDGNDIDSVSAILQRAGITDFSGVHPNILEDARKFGKAVHTLCEGWALRCLNLDKIDPLLEPYLEAFQAFEGKYVAHWINTEFAVYNEPYWYAGQADNAYCDKKGLLVLGDIKTATKVNMCAVRLQTVAYVKAYSSLGKKKEVDKRQVLHFATNKGGKVVLNVIELDDDSAALRRDFSDFCAVRQVVQIKDKYKIKSKGEVLECEEVQL